MSRFERLDAREVPLIYTGMSMCSLGGCFIAWVNLPELLICFLAFADRGNQILRATRDLANLWPFGRLQQKNIEAAGLIKEIFATDQDLSRYRLLIQGTEFQEKVWNILLNETAVGEVISYEDLASKVGGKNFIRAVASAVARNNISYLIPCHRVIRKSGAINQYRWGVEVKRKLLEQEKQLVLARRVVYT